MVFDPSRIDLAQLTSQLARRSKSMPADYVPGKTWIRDALAASLSCPLVEAERLVDILEGRGFVRFTRDPGVSRAP